MTDELIVVCVPAKYPDGYPDDKLTRCSACDMIVRHRPYVPEPSRKVCIGCFLALEAREIEFLPLDERQLKELAAQGIYPRPPLKREEES